MALFVAGLAFERDEIGRPPQQIEIQLADDRLPGEGLVRSQPAADIIGRTGAGVLEAVHRRSDAPQLLELGIAGAEDPRVSPVRAADNFARRGFLEDPALERPREKFMRRRAAVDFAQLL